MESLQESDEQLLDASRLSGSWRRLLRTCVGAHRPERCARSARLLSLGTIPDRLQGTRGWTEAVFARPTEDGRASSRRRSRRYQLAPPADLTGPRLSRDLGLKLCGRAARAPREDAGSSAGTSAVISSVPARVPGIRVLFYDLEVRAPLATPSRAAVYDLLVCTDEGIRTCPGRAATVRAGGTGSLLSSARRQRRTYDPDEIDDFFIIDGELMCYLIPVVTSVDCRDSPSWLRPVSTGAGGLFDPCDELPVAGADASRSSRSFAIQSTCPMAWATVAGTRGFVPPSGRRR